MRVGSVSCWFSLNLEAGTNSLHSSSWLLSGCFGCPICVAVVLKLLLCEDDTLQDQATWQRRQRPARKVVIFSEGSTTAGILIWGLRNVSARSVALGLLPRGN